MTKNNYSKLEKLLNVTFKNHDLIKTAFIHKSFLNENRQPAIESNERLEFLGDAVLELIATRHLFENYPTQSEGQMTSFRSALVKGQHLAEISRELGLGEYLYLSRGEERSGGREKNYILANTLESLIGAIYLDQGYECVGKFVQEFILLRLDKIIEQGLHIDSKSRFQELAQEKMGHTPYYEVLREEGPDHDKCFTMGAYIDGVLIAEGQGSSKQKAEDSAAGNALKAKNWE